MKANHEPSSINGPVECRPAADLPARILDVGCGRNKVPGALGTDRQAVPGVDVVLDLEQNPFPFRSESFDRIHARHVIEHVRDVGRFMGELHRIARPNAVLYLSTPHYSYMGSWRDPTHLHHFSIYTIEYFASDHPAQYYMGGIGWKIERIEVSLLHLWRRIGLEWLINLETKHSRWRFFRKFWEEYLAFLFRAREIRAVLTAKK